MANPKVEVLRHLLRLCTDETLHTAETIPEGARFAQLKEGKAHPLWLLGHLANTLDVVVVQWVLGEPKCTPPGFGRKFAPDFSGGLPITTDSTTYPAWEEVAGVYGAVRDKMIASMDSLTDADLPNPLRGNVPEPMRSFFDTNESTLMRMVRHDSYHRGQMAMLAKWHG